MFRLGYRRIIGGQKNKEGAMSELKLRDVITSPKKSEKREKNGKKVGV